MYIEDQYIYEQFQNNFIENRLDNLVIYGTGVHTQRLLEKLPDGSISGLMDAKRTGEILWGCKVLSYEEVAELENVSIVIIARNAVINVIYRRIETFCQENSINVYDVNGNNLRDNQINSIEKECFLLNEQNFLGEIQKYEVITFDIFDTLLVRNLIRARDIFNVIDNLHGEEKYVYSKERLKAEDSFLLGTNPDIYEIYNLMQENTGMNHQTKDLLIRLEFDTEKRFLKKRNKICEIFKKLVEEGKKVYLISDMYFTKEMLKELLAYFDITGYIDIFVSSEQKVAKQEGLFERFLELTGEKSEKCLHIGDNFYSDIIAARKAGMSSYQIYSPMELLENSVYRDALAKCNSVEESIVLGNFATLAFGNPFEGFEADGKIKTGSIDKISRLFIAPIITKYVLWLTEGVRRMKNDVVIFPSRDGFLLKQIYEKLQKVDVSLPKGIYFYTSRRAALVAAASEKKDIEYIGGINYSKDSVSMLKDRFDLVVEEVATGDLVSDVLERYMDRILQACLKERNSYLYYIKDLEIDSFENAAFVDFVAMGSIQEALERLTKKKFCGYYFLRRSADKNCLEKLKIESMYPVKGDFQIDANIYKFYYFLENIITSYEPTFLKMDSSGHRCFYPETRTNAVLNTIEEIHKSIIQYAEELFRLLMGQRNKHISIELCDMLLGFFSEEYSNIDMTRFEGFTNVDEFMGKIVKEINR